MSDVSSQRSVGEESSNAFAGNDNDKKGEDSWTDVSLNDDSDTKGRNGELAHDLIEELPTS